MSISAHGAKICGLSTPETVKAALDGCPAPQINTIAGTGIAGSNGDGLPPVETNLYLPQDVTVGPDGDVYLVDWNNHRIRRIRDGVVETVAGTGELGEAKDGDALYAQFNHPTNVTFDADGRMIIAAWHNSLVKRLDLSTGLLTNLAGTGARAFGGDGGPGNDAKLDLPSSVVVDSVGNILISDQANYRLRILEPSGTINTFAGVGTPGDSPWTSQSGFRMNAAPRRDVHLADQFGRAFVVEMPEEPAVDYWPGETVTSIDEGGERFLVQLARAEGGAGGGASDGAIIAPMPGKVISVDVAAGESVTKGQKLMVLEAMKMEHALTAPFDGVVEELNAVAGAQVQVEALLAQIKKAEG